MSSDSILLLEALGAFRKALNLCAQENGMELSDHAESHFVSTFLATCRKNGVPNLATTQAAAQRSIALLKEG